MVGAMCMLCDSFVRVCCSCVRVCCSCEYCCGDDWDGDDDDMVVAPLLPELDDPCKPGRTR